MEAHRVMSGTQIVSPHPEFFRNYPTVYAHEISIKMDTEPVKKPNICDAHHKRQSGHKFIHKEKSSNWIRTRRERRCAIHRDYHRSDTGCNHRIPAKALDPHEQRNEAPQQIHQVV